jgi:hypothetical protein
MVVRVSIGAAADQEDADHGESSHRAKESMHVDAPQSIFAFRLS